MKYIATADTDIGISKDTNQDSILFKHANTGHGEVMMAIVCDGMGGLEKGEVASASVIQAFSGWFDEELPFELEHLDMEIIGEQWSLLLKDLNSKILDYSKAHRVDGMGTTFSGILFVDNKYVIAHVGDSRIYHIDSKLKQITTDQTFIAREISKGTMTAEQAKTDKRRNLLLQCIGASRVVEPEVLVGETKEGIYMLCSDGFRHEINEEEIYKALNPKALVSKGIMHKNAKMLIDTVKKRDERDNISVILVKAQ